MANEHGQEVKYDMQGGIDAWPRLNLGFLKQGKTPSQHTWRN